MMRFEPTPEPPGWQEEVVDRGCQWLAMHTHDADPPAWWRTIAYQNALRDAFRSLCAYTCSLEHNGQSDHFIPWGRVRGTDHAPLQYAWSNLRYSAPWFNAAKGVAPVPDPFVVEDDWFELVLPSLELIATPRVPPTHRADVDRVLRWIGRDERVLRQRAYWWDRWRRGQADVALLTEVCPLLARALRADGDPDRWRRNAP